MRHVKPPNEDPLLRRSRRSVAKARRFAPGTDDRRLALVLIAEIRNEIEAMSQRLRAIEGEIQNSTRRVVAVNAYSRCAALVRRPTTIRSEGAKR